MTTPREPIEELIAADPARLDASYPEINAMMARAISAPPRAKTSGSFRLRIAAAALSASALTTAGIAALTTAAPRLPMLALSETASTVANASDVMPSTGKMSSGAMLPYYASDYSFHDADLPALTSSAAVWSLHSSVTAQDVARLAAALGVRGTPVKTSNSDGTVTFDVTDSDRGSVTVTVTSDNSLANWFFSSTSTGVVSSIGNTTNPADSAQYREWGQRVIAALRDGWTYGTPEVYAYDDVDQMRAGASVNYRVTLEGLATDLGLYLSFDGSGDLLSASGQLGEARRVGVYPLVGSRDGVRLLQQQNDAAVDVVNTAEATPQSGLGGSTSGSDGDLAPDVSPRVQKFDVQLTSVTIELWSARVNGGQYLVPHYVYSGTVSDASDAEVGWSSTWPLVAVSEKYITIDASEPSPIAISARR